MHDPGETCQHFSGKKAAPVMSPLRPGVGIKQIDPVQGPARQRFYDRPGIAIVEPHIPQRTGFDERQRLGNAIQEGLAADITRTGMCKRLGGQMLAAAKANFEPERGGPVWK